MDLVTLDNENMLVAVDILAWAFHDDPVLNWISTERGFLRRFFEFTLPHIVPQGLSYMNRNGDGAAAWLAPDSPLQWPTTPANLWHLLSMGGARGLYRFARSGMKSAQCHPREPHYSLFTIGVLPGHQGKGIGSSLLAPMLRRCDQEQMPAYLENSKPGNLRFYEGHGFTVLEQTSFTRSAPPIWLMWREPRPTR